MKDIDNTPEKNNYTGEPIDVNAKKEYVNQVIKSFVKEHVVNNIPQVPPQSIESNKRVRLIYFRKCVLWLSYLSQPLNTFLNLVRKYFFQIIFVTFKNPLSCDAADFIN